MRRRMWPGDEPLRRCFSSSAHDSVRARSLTGRCTGRVRSIRWLDADEGEITFTRLLEGIPTAGTGLMFEKGFAGKLIGFGYDDARDKHSELEAFFRRDRPQDVSRYSQFVC